MDIDDNLLALTFAKALQLIWRSFQFCFIIVSWVTGYFCGIFFWVLAGQFVSVASPHRTASFPPLSNLLTFYAILDWVLFWLSKDPTQSGFFRFQNTFWLLNFISPRGGGFQCSHFSLLRQENCFGFSTHLGIFAAVAFHTTTLSFPLHMFCEPLFFEQCLLKKFFSFSFVMLFRLPIFVPFVPFFQTLQTGFYFSLKTARENFQHNGMSKQPLLKPTYEQMKLITGFLQIVGTSAQAFLIAEELVLCVSVCVSVF